MGKTRRERVSSFPVRDYRLEWLLKFVLLAQRLACYCVDGYALSYVVRCCPLCEAQSLIFCLQALRVSRET